MENIGNLSEEDIVKKNLLNESLNDLYLNSFVGLKVPDKNIFKKLNCLVQKHLAVRKLLKS